MKRRLQKLLGMILALVLLVSMIPTGAYAATSTLKITRASAITTIQQGKSWSCSGVILSNYKITSVTGKITDTSGNVKYSKTVNPNATSYSLKGSAIDQALQFGKLTAGSYRYIITAADASGRKATLVTSTFTVTNPGAQTGASTLKISNATSPTTLEQGKSWSLTGTITSNYKITSVVGKILDSSGKVLYSASVVPNSTKYALKGSTIDSKLSFGKLTAGSYRYTISAKDASGISLTLIDSTFTVQGTAAAVESTLKITGATALTTLEPGKSWNCTGTITSNYKITSVVGKILDSSGKTLYTATAAPNATSYTLKRSAVDNGLSFGKLTEGTYRYTITAADSSGKSLTLVDNLFTVATAEESTLKITGASQLTTLEEGKSWSCIGTVSSNYKLTSVEGKILDSTGAIKYSATATPNVQSYSLKAGVIDNGLKFGKLTAGSYRYIITATDASGKTLTLVDNSFTVTAAGKAEESTLKIEGAKTLTTLEQGKTWSISGTITSNYNITGVVGKILDSTGAVKYTASAVPNAMSYTLKSSAIDNGLSFGKLAAGSYRYTIIATDASGKTLTLVDNQFTVTGAAEPEPEPQPEPTGESTLKIEGAKTLTTLEQGKYWSISGTITSNYKITGVVGQILDSTGKVMDSASAAPNETSFVLKASTIDNNLSFGKLAVGSYRYTVTATDASGKTLMLVDNSFTVTEPPAEEKTDATTDPTAAASTLKITDVTAITSLTKGTTMHCTGTISSNYALTKIVGTITDEAGNVKFAASTSSAATTYTLKNSAIDNVLSFGSLDVGNYRYTITVTDASGKTLTLVDNQFAVVE